MSKYRKKPVVIEAIQWRGRNTKAVLEFMGQKVDLSGHVAMCKWDDYCNNARSNGLDIKTLEDGSDGRAKHVADVNDWIIKGVQGEFYACKPDIFEATYEKID